MLKVMPKINYGRCIVNSIRSPAAMALSCIAKVCTIDRLLLECRFRYLYFVGATVVIAAVLGPIEVKTQNLSIEGSYLECNYRPKAGLPQVKERIREAAIRDVLELAILSEAYPRAKMSLQVQELEDRGSVSNFKFI